MRTAKNQMILVTTLVGCFMAALTGGIAWAAPIYNLTTQQQQDSSTLSVDYFYTNPVPEQNILPFRWYWSYEDRYDIDFEAVTGLADISNSSEQYIEDIALPKLIGETFLPENLYDGFYSSRTAYSYSADTEMKILRCTQVTLRRCNLPTRFLRP